MSELTASRFQHKMMTFIIQCFRTASLIVKLLLFQRPGQSKYVLIITECLEITLQSEMFSWFCFANFSISRERWLKDVQLFVTLVDFIMCRPTKHFCECRISLLCKIFSLIWVLMIMSTQKAISLLVAEARLCSAHSYISLIYRVPAPIFSIFPWGD